VSVKIIAELNPVSTKRTTLTAGAKPIADIIRELNTGFPLSYARVSRNGEIVRDFTVMAEDGDTLWIKFVPYGSPSDAGAGMKVGGWAIAVVGIVLTAVFGWTGIGGLAGAALIGTGLSMALGGTVLMNINIPSLKDQEKPENDPSIRGGKNQARPHGRVPVLFGRHRLYPDLAANSYTQIIDGKQYYTQLFCGGYKDCVIDLGSLKLGETALVELSQTKSINKVLSDADPLISLEILQNGEPSSLYPNCIHEDAVNAPLKNQTDEGISGAVIRTTPDKTNSINVDIFLYNGIGKYNNDGELKTASVIVSALYKYADDPDSAYQSLGFFYKGSNTLSGAELKTKRYQITKSGLPPGRYTVKIERITPDSTDSKIVDQVYTGSIRSIKSVRPIRAERQQNLIIVVLRVMATSQLNGVVDSFNYVATSKMPVYSGGGSGSLYWLNTAETRNPAAVLLYALQGRAAQQIIDPNDIDWTALESFYTWCEEHDYTCNAYLSESVTIADLLRMIGSTARADILRIDSKISVVQDIERPSPMQLFTPKNTKSYSVTMFNADIPDAIALRYIDEDAGFAQNELQVYNTPDGNRSEEPETTQKTDLWGITNSAQARRIGMYNYGCLTNRPFVHTIEVDIEYLLCNKGDWIQYAGDIALTGVFQGRIKDLIWAEGLCIGFYTDEPALLTDKRQAAVRIRKSDGVVILKDVTIPPGKRSEWSLSYYPGSGGDLHDPSLNGMYPVDDDNVYYIPGNEIYFIEPFEENEAPAPGDIYACGIRGYEALDLIITGIQPQADLSATLTCVEYSPAIFGVDSPDFILPIFENRISPVSGAVDSGVVSSDRLKLFVIYHDGDEEPPKPSSDGQEGGWHYAQTLRSVWQSSKMAESVNGGEWGPPIRIKNERGDADVTPIWLSLSPQNKALESDSEGNILAGLLPFTSQARLFRWNSLILEGIVFSLLNAPAGVSIDNSGLITVGAGALLNDQNSITVKAEYQDSVYTAALSVTMDRSSSAAPRYLGTVGILSATAQINIVKGPVQGQVYARQGDYVLAIAAVGGRQAGSVFQWTGLVWEYRATDRYTDLYLRCFKDGLDVPGLAYDMEWFGAVFAKLIVAQQAFIEELQAQMIQVSNTIFGGSRFTKNAQGQIVDNGPGLTGFRLGSDGKLVASGVEIQSPNFNGTNIADRAGYKYDNDGNAVINNLDTANLKLPSMYRVLNKYFNGFQVSGALRGFFKVKDAYHQGGGSIGFSDNGVISSYTVVSIPGTSAGTIDGIEFTFSAPTSDEIQQLYSCAAFSYWMRESGDLGNGFCRVTVADFSSGNKTVKYRIIPVQQNGQGIVFPSSGTNTVTVYLFLFG